MVDLGQTRLPGKFTCALNQAVRKCSENYQSSRSIRWGTQEKDPLRF